MDRALLSGRGIVDKIFRNPRSRERTVQANLPSTPGRSWREALPVLTGLACTLREPVVADAPALLMALGPHDLHECQPLSATPTIDGVEALISRLHDEREAGTIACWAIVPAEAQAPVGLIIARGLDHGFTMVGLSAVVASEFRGTGLFQDAARAVLDGLFGSLGVHRLEVRVDVRNARANGALRKLGATQEGVLRHAQFRDGAYRDHVLWAIVSGDRTSRDFDPPRIH